MNKETETTEKGTEEEFSDPTGYVGELEKLKSFKDMAEARGDEEEEEAAETDAGVEEHEAVDIATEKSEVEAAGEEPFLTLKDGTVLTKEEAVAGYMRHSHYTQERMKDAQTAKEMEQYSGIIAAMKTDKVLFDMVDEHIRGKGQAQPAAQPQAAKVLTVPDNYKGDTFVEGLVVAQNQTNARLAQLEGGVGNIKQEAVDKQKNSENEAIYYSRLQGAFEKLQGQLGDSKPSPDDFINRMSQHFEGKGLTPEQYMPMIIGPDSTYFSANVTEAYRDDIGKVVKDKVSSKRETRQPKGAAKRALKATGKPPKPASQKVPRLPDGSLDMSKFMGENPVWNEDKQG